jgi:hypothetical protein
VLSIVLIIAAVVTGALAALVSRRSTTPLSGLVRAVGVVLAIVGVLAILASGGDLQQAFDSRTWPSTTGTILGNKVVGERASHPNVVYRYTVDSDTFLDSTDLGQPSFGGKRKRREVAQKRSATYFLGDTLTVYYDPHDPTRSTLSTSPAWSDYGKAGLGVLLVALGVTLATGFGTRAAPAGTAPGKS